MNPSFTVDLPPATITCLLCRKAVWILSFRMPAALKSECRREDCPINADCAPKAWGFDDTLPFAYQVTFVDS